MTGPDRLRGLDGLRALSILAVVFHHASPRPLPSVLGKGAVGVDLFFVLSGFLITRNLLSSAKPDYRTFYFRRALRILPLYYLVLFSTLALELTHPEDSGSRSHLLSHFAYHLTFTSHWFGSYGASHPVPFAHAWSLCVEQQFYLFWPLILWSLGGHRGEKDGPRLLWPKIVLSLGIGLDWALEHRVLPGLTAFSASAKGGTLLRIATSFSLPIAAGCLLALAHESEALARAKARIPPVLFLGLGLGLSAWALSRTFTEYATLVAGLTLLLDGVVSAPQSSWTRRLEAAPLRFMGRVSYALYLSHFAGLAVARQVLLWLTAPHSALGASLRRSTIAPLLSADLAATCLTLVLGLGPALALAWLLHRFVERPCMEWARAQTQKRAEPA